jgi:hypothetical protein
LRGECRAFSGVTVVTNARVTYTTRAAAGASGARHSLRPLISDGQGFLANLAHVGGENAKLCLRVTRLFEIRIRSKHYAHATSSTVIARAGGRSSIPESLGMESKGRSVLDTRFRGL